MADEPFRLYQFRDLRQRTTPNLQWVVHGIVPKSGVALLVAKSGTGKSMLAYDLAASVLTGEDWLDAIPVMQGGVAYIDLDGEPDAAVIRGNAAFRGRNLDEATMDMLPFFLSADYTTYDICEASRVTTLIETVAAVPNLRLIIFDTYSDLHQGEEASADDMMDTMAAIVEIKHTLGCGVLIVHHQRKGESATLDDVRGSSAIIAKTDAVFFLKQERDAEGLPSLCTLIQRKARYTAEAKPRTLRMDAVMEGDDLISYRWHITDEQPVRNEMGRPSTAMAEAMGFALLILGETPDIERGELIQRLVAQGISQATAYRAAGQIINSQKSQIPIPWTFDNEKTADETDEDDCQLALPPPPSKYIL